MNLREWPGLLIAAIVSLWALLVIAYWWYRLHRILQKQSEEVSAVSGSLIEFALILLGPPALLVAAWLLLKRQ